MNSKKKGNRVELEFAKLFSKRFNDTFKRVPSSGAYGTSWAKDNVREDAMDILTGDIITPENFRFSIEVKSRIDFNFWDLLNRETINEIDEWIDQAERESKTANKKMLIIVKINRKKPFVIHKIQEIKEDLLYQNEYRITRLDYFLDNDDELFYKKG